MNRATRPQAGSSSALPIIALVFGTLLVVGIWYVAFDKSRKAEQDRQVQEYKRRHAMERRLQSDREEAEQLRRRSEADRKNKDYDAKVDRIADKLNQDLDKLGIPQ